MDFYILLGLDRGASEGEIKRAYRRLARRYHPDINPGDSAAAAQFRRIAEAYETLIDPERRRRYDVSGQPQAAMSATTFGFDGFDFSVSVSGDAAPTFGDLFAEVLQSRDRVRDHRGPRRGADLHHALNLSFDEALRGGHRQIPITRQEVCRTCHGSGHLNIDERRCPHCHGSGAVRSARGHMIFSKPCSHCGGMGQVRQQACPACRGEQVEMRAETLTVSIPPGLADGAVIRVQGKGHVGRDGGEAGDLLISVRVAPHELFRRDGDDLHIVVPIAIHEATLGARVEVPTPDGPARLRIPPGTQPGQRFRLHERGMPSPRDGRRGDLIVEVKLALPRVLDERSKELLREFGRINAEDVRAGLVR